MIKYLLGLGFVIVLVIGYIYAVRRFTRTDEDKGDTW